MDNVTLHLGDCIETMRGMEADSVDSIVTDPPYGLGFMGKKWDTLPPSLEVFTECLRVLKPGGHLLAFGGSRTYHRLAVAVEDAGFEIRDQIQWVYGSGFPKSQDVSKAIDKAAGAEREVVGIAGKSGSKRNSMAGDFTGGEYMATSAATPTAQQWQGWGTALKPAHEPIVMARKPLAKGKTIAANVMEYGTGAINVDGCRVGIDPNDKWAKGVTFRNSSQWAPGSPADRGDIEASANPLGRFPANLIHDGSDEVVGLFPDCKGMSGGGKHKNAYSKSGVIAGGGHDGNESHIRGDTGSAARFFYQAKANNRDRGEGNNHPTVKPTDLMRYLCRMVTPPGGTVLDPFMGSGSTGKAAKMEGFGFVGVEMEPDYMEIARQRIEAADNERDLFSEA